MSDLRVTVPLYLSDKVNLLTHFSSRDGKLKEGRILQIMPGRVMTSDGLQVNEVRFHDYTFIDERTVMFNIMDVLRQSDIKQIARFEVNLDTGDCNLAVNPYYLKHRLVMELHVNFNRVTDRIDLIEQGFHGHLL